MRTFILAAAALGAAGAACAQETGLERAKQIVSGRCFLCHGAGGENATELFARLAGQHPEYFATQLADFRDGRRKGGGMEQLAADLKNDEIRWLAAYFSAQKAEPFPASDRGLASAGRSLYDLGVPDRGVPACVSCHGTGGAGSATLPRLAGQPPAYTVRQLKQFSKRERTSENDLMRLIAAKLSDFEINALAEHLGELE